MAVSVKPTSDLSHLSPEERWRIEHEQMHERHRGHETMHLEMLLVLVLTLCVAQLVLVQWKKRHFKSYQAVTLVAMWIIPVFICLKRSWFRFLFFWAVFSGLNAVVALRATRAKVTATTPRMVYKWFLLLHKLSYVLGIAGYLVVMATLLGLNLLFGAKPHVWMDAGVLLLFYGLYYGVLGRDLAELCTDKMAAHMGYWSAEGLPGRVLERDTCAVCGDAVALEEEDGAERAYRLTCAHLFHEFCIRGWCIVGKKQTCPYCKEKVDLKRLFKNPWEKPHLFYGQLLDWIRYLVAWQPLIVTLVQGINWALGLE